MADSSYHGYAEFFEILSREKGAYLYPYPENQKVFYEFTSTDLREVKPKSKEDLVAKINDNNLSVEGVVEACKSLNSAKEFVEYLCVLIETKNFSGPILFNPLLRKSLFTAAYREKAPYFSNS